MLSLKATYKSVVDFKKQKSARRRDFSGRSKRKTFQGDGLSFQGIRWGPPKGLSEKILFVREILRINKSSRFILYYLRKLLEELAEFPSIFKMGKEEGNSQIVTQAT